MKLTQQEVLTPGQDARIGRQCDEFTKSRATPDVSTSPQDSAGKQAPASGPNEGPELNNNIVLGEE